MHVFSDYDLWKTDPDRIWGCADEREEDPFIEWASEEAERQDEMCGARHDGLIQAGHNPAK